MFKFFSILFLATSFASCTKDAMPTPAPLPVPYIFYGTEFIGHYEADQVISNGVNASNFVNLAIDLQVSGTPSQFLYKEINPSTGTTNSVTLDIHDWNLNPTKDSLFLQIITGSHTETTSYESGGEYSTTYYTDITVLDLDSLYMPFSRTSPGKYILEREYQGAHQKFYLTKW
jgi:hypothetical protein